MEITVVGRNIAVTDALRAYAEKKVDKLQKYFEREIVDAQVTMAVERGIHTADVTIQVDGLLPQRPGRRQVHERSGRHED